MGARERKLMVQHIRDIARAERYEIYSGEVDSVDTNNLTIDVKLNEGVVVQSVRLKATIDGDKGFYVVPKKNSHVKIAVLDGGLEFSLFQASEIDKIEFKIENTTFEADKDGIVINGGNNHGLVKLDEIKNNLDQIKTYLDTLKAATSAVASAVDTVVPGTGTDFTSATSGAVINYSNMENNKVKH